MWQNYCSFVLDKRLIHGLWRAHNKWIYEHDSGRFGFCFRAFWNSVFVWHLSRTKMPNIFAAFVGGSGGNMEGTVNSMTGTFAGSSLDDGKLVGNKMYAGMYAKVPHILAIFSKISPFFEKNRAFLLFQYAIDDRSSGFWLYPFWWAVLLIVENTKFVFASFSTIQICPQPFLRSPGYRRAHESASRNGQIVNDTNYP